MLYRQHVCIAVQKVYISIQIKLIKEVSYFIILSHAEASTFHELNNVFREKEGDNVKTVVL